MKKTSALHSAYIIDGIPQELTPAEILVAVTDPHCLRIKDVAEGKDKIIDETIDPILGAHRFDATLVKQYLAGVLQATKQMPLAFADTYTRVRLAAALIDALWSRGSFRLGDLQLKATWRWNDEAVGSYAAFYTSVLSAADYIDALGLKFNTYSYSRINGQSEVVFKPVVAPSFPEDDDVFIKQPYHTEHPRISPLRACPVSLVPDPQSWIVYIPFETSDYRLGGSLLAQTLGLGGGVPPHVGDADYFIDCFEVVREFVEDKILLSGNTVRYGGLIKALAQMTSDEVGARIDISGIMKSYHENDIVRILFSEVPGAIVQIRDIDFDYLDAQLLLQDVAFFPLGHPVPGCSDIQIDSSAKSGIQSILETLIQNAEGED